MWRDSKPTPSTPGAALPDSSDWPNAAQAPQTNYSMRKQNCDKSTLSSAAVQEAEVERIDDQLGKHPIGKCRPQGRSPPLEQRRGLVEFPTLLLDTPNPRLAHAKVRRNFPSASPPVARCEHLATELFRIRFYRHLLECACITQPSQMALDLCQMRSRTLNDRGAEALLASDGCRFREGHEVCGIARRKSGTKCGTVSQCTQGAVLTRKPAGYRMRNTLFCRSCFIMRYPTSE